MNLATYFVAFEPSIRSGPQPQVILHNKAKGITRALPCLLSSGVYTIAWSLAGETGDSAPGLIRATPVADRFGVELNGGDKLKAHADPGKVGCDPIAPCPIGLDRESGLPMEVTDSVVHDFVYEYELPHGTNDAIPTEEDSEAHEAESG